MPLPVLRRRMRPLAFFFLQAALWLVLMVAFATLIDLSGWATWADAVLFSAANWLPWIVIAPAVFWLATRFPLERGRLLRSVPVHAFACFACAVLALWISAYSSPSPRPPGPPGPRGGGPFGGEARSDDSGAVERADRSPRAGRGGFDRELWDRRRLENATGRGGPPPDDSGDVGPGGRGGPGGPGGRGGGPGGRGFGPGGGGGPDDFRRPRPFGFWPGFTTTLLRVNFSAALYLIVAAAAHALGYYRRAQDRERQALALTAGLNRAKLDALRLQLQPHFLFNTLNAISTLVHRDANAADELIGDLSELLRLSLLTADHEVPLSRELELLDCYLAIEQTRLGDRLRIVREIDPAGLAALVPTFLLQPLAENAIRHGIEPRRSPGTLTIRATVEHGTLRLVVADDGVGLKATEKNSGRRGIGIVNSEERLRALHGAAAKLELVSPEAGGVQVQIVLPVRTTSSAPPDPRTAAEAEIPA